MATTEPKMIKLGTVPDVNVVDLQMSPLDKDLLHSKNLLTNGDNVNNSVLAPQFRGGAALHGLGLAPLAPEGGGIADYFRLPVLVNLTDAVVGPNMPALGR